MMNFHAVGAQLERGVRRLATMLRTPTLGEQVRNLHSAYCHSQSQFTEAAAVLRAVRADLNAYHKADDDRISVAVIRIDMWADGKPGADKCPMNAVAVKDRVAKLRADRDALGLKRLELYAHPDDWPAIKALAAQLVVAREYAGPATSRLTFELSGALCSHQDPNNCNRERDCPAFVALPKTTSERVAKLREGDSLSRCWMTGSKPTSDLKDPHLEGLRTSTTCGCLSNP